MREAKVKTEWTSALCEMRDEGYAVIVWSPEELADAPPHRVEDRSIELCWDVIEAFNGDGDEDE